MADEGTTTTTTTDSPSTAVPAGFDRWSVDDKLDYGREQQHARDNAQQPAAARTTEMQPAPATPGDLYKNPAELARLQQLGAVADIRLRDRPADPSGYAAPGTETGGPWPAGQLRLRHQSG